MAPTSPYLIDPTTTRLPRSIGCGEHGGYSRVQRHAEIKHPDGSRHVYAYAWCEAGGGHEHGERIGCSQPAPARNQEAA